MQAWGRVVDGRRDDDSYRQQACTGFGGQTRTNPKQATGSAIRRGFIRRADSDINRILLHGHIRDGALTLTLNLKPSPSPSPNPNQAEAACPASAITREYFSGHGEPVICPLQPHMPSLQPHGCTQPEALRVPSLQAANMVTFHTLGHLRRLRREFVTDGIARPGYDVSPRACS